MLKRHFSARIPCGPKEISIGDIVAIDFSVLVVNGTYNGEKGLRMISVLRGIDIIQKFTGSDVSEKDGSHISFNEQFQAPSSDDEVITIVKRRVKRRMSCGSDNEVNDAFKKARVDGEETEEGQCSE